jgi:hypothetical protein
MVSAFRDTLVHPDSLIKDASHDRLELSKTAGVVEMGLDAAATVKAANSVEKMLSHELPATHAVFMKLVGQMQNAIAAMPDPCRTAVLSGDYGSLNKELCRASGAIACLGIAMQQGALALQRLRQGARQTVRVEHVQVTQVAPGGQAGVAGRVGGGANGGVGSRKSARPEGRERCRRSSWKHGHYSAESKTVRRKARLHLKALRRLVAIAEQVIEIAPPPPPRMWRRCDRKKPLCWEAVRSERSSGRGGENSRFNLPNLRLITGLVIAASQQTVPCQVQQRPKRCRSFPAAHQPKYSQPQSPCCHDCKTSV